MIEPITVLQLAGSAVDEFHAELSRLYAAESVAALRDSDRYRFVLAHVRPGGTWQFPTDFTLEALQRAPEYPLVDALARLDAEQIDVVVPQMFCRPGMTSYRTLFDVLAIPLLGNTATTMANATDKARARAIVSAAGVAVPTAEILRAGDCPTLAPPVVVKPVDADNSVGVTLVNHSQDYPDALTSALAHSDSVLVERYVALGREVRCGVLVRDGELLCLPLEEYAVDPVCKPIRGAEDKLARDDADELFLVAKSTTRAWIVPESDPITDRVWEAARRCHLALGCRHYSLFDFRIDPDGRPWFLEAGLYNSFAPSSVLAMMSAAAGTDVRELFAAALRELQHNTKG